jgi:predicted nucleic acid-binding protein
MKVALDLNVVLDVAQNRIPHYQASEEVVRRARAHEFEAVLPSHALTTLHYVLEKWGGGTLANQTIDELLSVFTIYPADTLIFKRARALLFADFEDAVVAAIAEASKCDFIITRNVADFGGSPVIALSPADFLAHIAAKGASDPE